MTRILKLALALSVISIGGLSSAQAGDRYNPLVSRPGHNASHWIYQRRGTYNPLISQSRYGYGYGQDSVRTSRGLGYYDRAKSGPLGQSGTLRIAGTRYPIGPKAHIINVDSDLVELAERRAAGRLERFEAEKVEILFHTPRQAYDARFPSVIYLDSR